MFDCLDDSFYPVRMKMVQDVGRRDERERAHGRSVNQILVLLVVVGSLSPVLMEI
jgi:hypothetical protein